MRTVGLGQAGNGEVWPCLGGCRGSRVHKRKWYWGGWIYYQHRRSWQNRDEDLDDLMDGGRSEEQRQNHDRRGHGQRMRPPRLSEETAKGEAGGDKSRRTLDSMLPPEYRALAEPANGSGARRPTRTSACASESARCGACRATTASAASSEAPSHAFSNARAQPNRSGQARSSSRRVLS